MNTLTWAWRAILWSWVAASVSSRSYMDPESCMNHADKIVAGFDRRFEAAEHKQ